MKKLDVFARRVQLAMGGWMVVCTAGALMTL